MRVDQVTTDPAMLDFTADYPNQDLAKRLSETFRRQTKKKAAKALFMGVSPLALAACGGSSGNSDNINGIVEDSVPEQPTDAALDVGSDAILENTAQEDDVPAHPVDTIVDIGSETNLENSVLGDDTPEQPIDSAIDIGSENFKKHTSAITIAATNIDYQVAGFNSYEVRALTQGGVDGQIYLDSKVYGNFIITPAQDNLQPSADGVNRYFPIIEYTIQAGHVEVHRIVEGDNFILSKPHDFLEVNGQTAFLFGGHGPEFSDGREWPFGDLFIGSFGGDEIHYKQISGATAFYHGISAGDINNDGFDDIAAVHMGATEVDGHNYPNFHYYLQDADGNFSRQLLNLELPATSGGSSIFIGNLDDDPENEILIASYGNGFSKWYLDEGGELEAVAQPYSFVILEYDPEQNGLIEAAKHELDGSLLIENGRFGVIDIAALDYDDDGDDDLLMLLENSDAEFALEIYQNEGNLEFTNKTNEVFSSAYTLADGAFFRNIATTDLQDDGFVDFVLSGRQKGITGDLDLGQFIFVNDRGNEFYSLEGEQELTIDQSRLDLNGEYQTVRTIKYLEAEDETVNFILTQGDTHAMDFLIVEMDVGSFLL